MNARTIFENLEDVKGTPDGPAIILLEFMSSYDYVAPENWDGHRIINE